ncbi:SDR family NAD(P)-dependent oxidoreductase [Nostoc sp.]|uniref:SDR family NAD(P)-dependent oxidoreductase n=1 Tax=Nostoc sp. TaxID=1180 RepID=UPI002FFD3B86
MLLPIHQLIDSKPFAYNASKAAVNAFTIHLAHELRNTPVKINSAHPGWVKTELGGEGATIDIAGGAKTGVELAMLPDDGPSGGFFHLGEPVPW